MPVGDHNAMPAGAALSTRPRSGVTLAGIRVTFSLGNSGLVDTGGASDVAAARVHLRLWRRRRSRGNPGAATAPGGPPVGDWRRPELRRQVKENQAGCSADRLRPTPWPSVPAS